MTPDDAKPLFLRGPSPSLRLLFCVVLSLVLMTVDHREQHLDTAREVMLLAVYPLQWAVDAPFRAVDWASETLASRTVLIDTNRRLRERALADAARLQRLQSLEAENRRLRELLDSAEQVGYQVLVAGLMSVDMDPYRHQMVINRGTRDDVHRGQAIIDAHGVVGQVSLASTNSSYVVLITDPSHALPVEVNRNGLRTIVRGTGSPDRLELPYLPVNADIENGDLLVTSGLGGSFPAGYPVGVVTRVDRPAGEHFAEVNASPLAKLHSSREVLLIREEIE